MKTKWVLMGAALLSAFVIAFFLLRAGDTLENRPKRNAEALSSKGVLEPTPTGSSLPGEAVDKATPAREQTEGIQTEDQDEDNGEEKQAMPSKDEFVKKLRYYLNREFEEEAKEVLPLLAIVTPDPRETEHKRLKEGEIWIRINPGNSREMKDIMAQAADLYKEITLYDKPVTVILWVGGRPWARFQYPPPGEENEGESKWIEDE